MSQPFSVKDQSMSYIVNEDQEGSSLNQKQSDDNEFISASPATKLFKQSRLSSASIIGFSGGRRTSLEKKFSKVKFQQSFEELLQQNMKEESEVSPDIISLLSNQLKYKGELSLKSEVHQYTTSSKKSHSNKQEQAYVIAQEKIKAKSDKKYESLQDMRNEKQYNKSLKKAQSYYSVILKRISGFHRLIYELKMYQDTFKWLMLRKTVVFGIYSIFIICKLISRSTITKLIMAANIMANVGIFIYGNINRYEKESLVIYYESIILNIYIIELVIRIMANGFLITKYSFFRCSENWYDLILTFLFILHIRNPSSVIDFSPLRLITLLIYISNLIVGLRNMLKALGKSFKFVTEAIFVVSIFTILFALIGTSLFKGLINFRCVPLEGPMPDDWIFCSTNRCPQGMECQYQDDTPNIPTSFNNILFSFAQVLRTITMDDWTYIMYFTLKTYNSAVWVYYLGIIFFGGFFGFNLVIAVLKTFYSEQVEKGQKEFSIHHICLRKIKAKGQYEMIQQFKQYLNSDLLLIHRPEQLRTKYFRSQSKEPRQLSGVKKESIQYHNTLLGKLKKCNLKYFLLPKFKNLNNFQNTLALDDFEKQEFDQEFLQLVLLDEFTRFQPQPIFDDKYKSTSWADVLLTVDELLNFRRLKKKYKYYQNYRKKYVYPFKPQKIQPEKKKLNFPFKIRDTFQPENNQTEVSEDYVAHHLRLNNSRTITFAGMVKQSPPKPKIIQFRIKKDNEVYLRIQGIYLNYKKICERINSKIPKRENTMKDYQKKYEDLKESELTQKVLTTKIYSGNNVIPSYSHTNEVKKAFNIKDTLVWLRGTAGILILIRKWIFLLINSQLYQIMMDIILFVNFFALASSGIMNESTIYAIENFTTITLIIEFFCRVTAYSPSKFVKNTYFVLESFIVALNFIEFSLKSILNLSEIVMRLMRATKSMLFYRCLKYNRTAVLIGYIAQKTFKQYIYLTELMFMAILCYALLGMEVYGNEFDQTTELGQLHSFDDPFKAFMTVFNIMTNDDWYGVLVLGTEINKVFSMIYSCSMVFCLNYIIYGLVMAILLDQFGIHMTKEDYIHEDSTQDLESEQSDIEEEKKDYHHYFNSSQSLQVENPTPYQYLLKSINAVVKQRRIKKLQIYNGIECRDSLFIFNKKNQFRQLCVKLCKNSIYKYIYDLLILGSIIIDALQTYPAYPDDMLESFLTVCNILITIHIMISIIALGFTYHKGAYLKYMWQLTDLIYLAGFLLDKIFQFESSTINLIMYLRFLRPYKLLYRFDWVVKTYKALVASLYKMIDVLITMILIWTMFGVFAIILYQDQFGYCENKMQFNVNKQDCLSQNRDWVVYKHNFDNITIALPTLFIVSTFDGWGEILQVAQNSQPEDLGPSPYANQVATYPFFISFCFVGSMFFLSLFTGLLFVYVKVNEQKIEYDTLTEPQLEFIKISKLIFEETVVFSYPAKRYIRKLAKQIVFNSHVQRIAFFFTLLDSVIQLSFYQNMDIEIARSLNRVYQVDTILFIFWITLNILTHGIYRYMDDSWRQFYIFIAIISIIDLFLDLQFDWFIFYFNSNVFTSEYQIYRLVFMLRNLRMLILFQGFQRIQRLVRVMLFAIPFLGRILFIQTITTISFALLGNQLYGHIDKGDIFDDQINFKTFTNSLLTLLKCISCDNFRTIMTDTMIYNPYCKQDPKYCGSQYSQLFFITFVFLSNYILINLFVLGLIEQFEKFYQIGNSMIQVYIEQIDKIKTIWCKYSYDTGGKAMRYKFLCRFLLDVGEPFLTEDENLWDSAKLAGYLNVQADDHGYIQFNQLVYELFRRTFKGVVFHSESEQGNKQMKQFNKTMQLRLRFKRANRKMKRTPITQYISLNSNFSVLNDYFTVLIMFKAWQNYSEKILLLSMNMQENFTERSSQASRNSVWDVFSQDSDDESALSSGKNTPNENSLRNPSSFDANSMQERQIQKLPYYIEDLKSKQFQVQYVPENIQSSQNSIISSSDGRIRSLEDYIIQD